MLAGVKTYRDEAIICLSQPLGEADRILTLLTRHHGLKRVVAKGSRRTQSRLGGRVEVFNHIDALAYRGRTFDVLTEVACPHPYAKLIAEDFDLYTTASSLAEIAMAVSVEEEADEGAFMLLYGALAALATRQHNPRLILDSFILRILAHAGWAMSIHECAVCGSENPTSGFSAEAGGLLCAQCAGNAIRPAQRTVELLAYLASGNWVGLDQVTPSEFFETDRLIEQFLRWQLEKNIRALRMAPGLEGSSLSQVSLPLQEAAPSRI